jgi:tetratricopeptide (TPR) repeat protein
MIVFLAGCMTSPQRSAAPSPEVVSQSPAVLDGQLNTDEEAAREAASDDFLELPGEVRAYLDREIVPLGSEEERYYALRAWAFEDFGQRYEYDPSFTSPLEDLPESRRINCFSFSNLFVAAARYADISASFQLVESPPAWDINKKTWVISQHINVTGSVYRELSWQEKANIRSQQQSTGTLIRRNPPKRMRRTYVVDLNPEIAVDAYRSRVISDRAAEALFHSNRSVEELLAGNREAALKHGRLAIAADESSPTAWNNLGVLLSRQGKLTEAKQAYRKALALDPDVESAANNLERIYRRTGELGKADAMVQQIRANRQKNPYYHYALGERMLAEGDPESAVEHFEDAIRRKEDERLFYYALAEAQIKLGEYRKASRNLEVAKEHSTRQDMGRYNALSHQLSSATGEG